MKRTRFKAKDANKELAQYSIKLSKNDKIEFIKTEKHTLLMINEGIDFFYYEYDGKKKLLPTLKKLQQYPHLLKQIAVDMGAVRFIVNGADIMRPGIVQIPEGLVKDEFIVIVDEKNSKPLAVGIALLSSEEIRQATSGKVVKNIHYVGDELWNWKF